MPGAHRLWSGISERLVEQSREESSLSPATARFCSYVPAIAAWLRFGRRRRGNVLRSAEVHGGFGLCCCSRSYGCTDRKSRGDEAASFRPFLYLEAVSRKRRRC